MGGTNQHCLDSTTPTQTVVSYKVHYWILPQRGQKKANDAVVNPVFSRHFCSSRIARPRNARPRFGFPWQPRHSCASDRESGGFTFKVEDFPCINKSAQFSSESLLSDLISKVVAQVTKHHAYKLKQSTPTYLVSV